MKWIVGPLLLLFAGIEFFLDVPVCGSGVITGKMWFMWLVMGVLSSRIYWEKCRCRFKI